MVACLVGGEGTAASHRAAGRLFSLPSLADSKPEISTPRRVKYDRAIVHRVDPLQRCDVTSIRGFPVTRAARTILDLASVVSPVDLENIVDDALRRRLTTLARLQWRLEELGRGRKGAKDLRRLLAERAPDVAVPESVLERKVLAVLKEGGLPDPECQFVIQDGGQLVARVDFAYPSHLVAIEAEGYAFHSGRQAWEKDLARRNRLQKMGWRTIHVTWRLLEERPKTFVATVKGFLDHQTTFVW
jgi:very-short-patch-repair endonuclease